MRDLFSRIETPFLEIYQSLQGVRETFHREGRISDANAKLDETVKFLAVHFGSLKGFVRDEDYRTLSARETFTVCLLNQVFSQLATNPVFQRQGMGFIFGENPSTIFRDGDETIAFELFTAAGQAFGAQTRGEENLDILNEAFGHHVRDNFRNHIEDAQYMTPPEVVNFMVDMAIELAKENRAQGTDEFILADPSCGVGSFLTRWRTAYEKRFGIPEARTLKCIGQDKVDRMVRLSAVNLIFSERVFDDVFLGNSIDDESPIGDYNGKIDLILTNPPFGARFTVGRLKHTSPRSTPFFAKMLTKTKSIDSELLFIDRYLTLLKPGGVCLAIVPDGVISARGTAALTRQHLARSAEIIGIVELPSVTFAQAGTRTRTAVLGFRKRNMPKRSYPVFFSEVTDLGFQVSRRKGVPVKKSEGVDQLPQILSEFKSLSSSEKRETSSVVNAAWKTLSPCEHAAWTPRTILFDRKTLERRTLHKLLPLKEFTEAPRRREAQAYTEDSYFISVLHIIGEGILDISGIKSYQPVTPGLPVEPGEVLVSRINPRIPRVVVVPDLGRKILCSSEYEILAPRAGVSPYILAFALLSPFVQKQIQSLTAGTSASHSRIKPQKIYDVLVPDLRFAEEQETIKKLVSYEKACRKITASLIEIENIRNDLDL